jgi:hypothetical protein
VNGHLPGEDIDVEDAGKFVVLPTADKNYQHHPEYTPEKADIGKCGYRNEIGEYPL